jgi:MFS family permease|tara:strand:+ start:9536 stop:10096 length:561 start_codon:yes stop_codon:yes gene_type:complete
MKDNTLNYLNYRILLYSNSIVAFSMGLFMPFYVVFIQDFGGSIESFGFAFGLMILAQSSTSYFAGKYSDKFGRKIFLIVPGFLITILIILYTLITSLIQLYILQIILGISSAIQQTMETTMLGDVTEKVSRGANIGKYHAIIGVAAAIAMMGGGYVVGQLGIEIIFYIVAAFSLISTILLFYIKEK